MLEAATDQMIEENRHRLMQTTYIQWRERYAKRQIERFVETKHEEVLLRSMLEKWVTALARR